MFRETLEMSDHLDTQKITAQHEVQEVPVNCSEDTELQGLRRVPGTLPWTAYTIALVEFCERFSYVNHKYGTLLQPPD